MSGQKWVMTGLGWLVVWLLVSPQTFAADAGKTEAAGAAVQEAIDINSATKQQLMTLPGIGEAEAAKIIDGRPYHSKLELTQKKILPASIYKSILYKITVTEKK